jgi:DNA primase catalytic core
MAKSGGNGKPGDRSEVEQLKRTVSLVDLVASYGVQLHPQREGQKNRLAHCPWHSDGDPSFAISRDETGKWLWHCLSCKTGGDSLNFIQIQEKVGFKEALAKLRAFAGTLPPAPELAAPEAPPTTPRELPAGYTRHSLLQLALAHYQKRFQECPEAQAYLQNRGLGDPALWQTFGLGYCDGSILPTLPRNGDVRHGLTTLGVLNEYSREHFKGCIVVPLFHPDDGLVALYGRRIDPEARNRHLYLPGPKRGVLNWEALQTAPAVVLTEGILDTLSLWAAGVSNATCIASAADTASPDLEDLLSRYTVRQVVLCLDNDGRGREAAAHWYARLDAKGLAVRRVELPEKDANQVLTQHGPDVLRQAVTAPPKSPPPSRTLAAVVQPVADAPDSFLLDLDDVRYQVTPKAVGSTSMRVLLRAWHEGKQHPQTVDFYNTRHRTMAVNNLHRDFGLSKATLEAHMLALLEATERWKGGAGGAEQGSTPTPDYSKPREPVVPTEAERPIGMELLLDPNLNDRIVADADALGIVGEEENILMAYYIGSSRKMEKPLAGAVLSQSGAGKSSLMQFAYTLMPPEETEYYSRVSATAPGYAGRYAYKHKLLNFEERVGSQAADYALRCLLSQPTFRQSITQKDPVTGKMVVMDNVVEGPIAYLETTTDVEINEENSSRLFELVMTETEEQTARIHDRQRWSVSPDALEIRHLRAEIVRRHHIAQRCLEAILVAVPYWDKLTFPVRWLRTRRDHLRFLNLIMVSAFLHQFQRPQGVVQATGEVYVMATAADYRTAYRLAAKVLCGTLHDLPQSCQELWQAVHTMLSMRTQGKAGRLWDEVFTRKELRLHTGWSDRRVRDNLDKLVALEYVATNAGSQGKTFEYRLLPGGDAGSPLDALLTPDALEALLATQEAHKTAEPETPA